MEIGTLTTGVSLCQAKTRAVASVANRPTTANVTAAMAFWSLHLMFSTGITSQPSTRPRPKKKEKKKSGVTTHRLGKSIEERQSARASVDRFMAVVPKTTSGSWPIWGRDPPGRELVFGYSTVINWWGGHDSEGSWPRSGPRPVGVMTHCLRTIQIEIVALDWQSSPTNKVKFSGSGSQISLRRDPLGSWPTSWGHSLIIGFTLFLNWFLLNFSFTNCAFLHFFQLGFIQVNRFNSHSSKTRSKKKSSPSDRPLGVGGGEGGVNKN